MKLYKQTIITKRDGVTTKDEYIPEQETRKSSKLVVCGVCLGIFILSMVIGIVF